MENIIGQIEQADEIQLNEIIFAAICRYNTLHKDRQGSFLSLSADPRLRDQELENIIRFIHKP